MIRFLQKDSRLIKGIFFVIIGLAVVTMVITLVPGVFQEASATTDSYATVRTGGFPGRFLEPSTNIRESEVQQTAARQLQQQRIPEAYLPYLLPRAMQQAAQQLIQKALILREADRLGIKATDEDLRQFLHTGQFGAVLFPNGQYIGDEKYENLITSNFNISTQEFESEVKKDIIINRLRALVSSGATVTDKEVRDSYRDQGTKIKFEYAVLNADDVRKQINPTDGELQDFFKKNSARYQTAVPEARKLQYITFNESQIGSGVAQVTPQEVQQYYTQHAKEYETPDQVKVRHILIQVPATADAKTAAAAKQKADDLLKQIKAGGNFAELAKKNSDDPGSKATGGELGFLKHGATVPEFDKAAFTLSPGQTSDVIKTQFGYHILQVEEKQTAHTQALGEVRPTIEATLTRQKEAAQQSAFAQQLTSEAQKNGLAKTAEAHHLPIVMTDFIEQGGVVPGLPDGTKMLTQAFTMKQGGVPQSATTGEGYAIFQVVGIQPAHAPAFEAYKTHLLDDYREQQAPALLTAKTKMLEDKVRADGDLNRAAKEVGATVKTSDEVGRDEQGGQGQVPGAGHGQVPDIGQVSSVAPALFNLNVGQVSEPINTGRAGIVAKILEKQQPSAEDIAKNFDQTKDALLEERREEIFAVFVTSLQNKAQKAGEVRLAKKPAASPVGLGSLGSPK